MVRCVRVPRQEAERVRRAAIDSGVLNLDYRIGTEGGDILIPVNADSLEGYGVVDADLRPQERPVTDYRDIVTGIPDGLREQLPSSFDLVGDIAIMKMPDDLVPYAPHLGEALLRTSPNVRAVFMDGGVKGEFRIRELTRIAGTGDAVVSSLA